MGSWSVKIVGNRLGWKWRERNVINKLSPDPQSKRELWITTHYKSIIFQPPKHFFHKSAYGKGVSPKNTMSKSYLKLTRKKTYSSIWRSYSERTSCTLTVTSSSCSIFCIRAFNREKNELINKFIWDINLYAIWECMIWKMY